jgi:outer membrane lipoprotein carrier protein
MQATIPTTFISSASSSESSFPRRRESTAARTAIALLALILSINVVPTLAQETLPQADSAASELTRILNQTTSLQGQFEQNQYDVSNNFIGQSSGSFRMLRPGFFSWEITSPDNQLIIATPQYIWHHDKDLETVTRRPVSSSGTLTPLQILGGDEQLLRSQFEVGKSADDVFTLTPRDIAGAGGPGFSRLSISLEGGVISSMEIIDGLDQRVAIRFHNVDKTSELTPDDFAFTPPEGVDLFYYDQ